MSISCSVLHSFHSLCCSATTTSRFWPGKMSYCYSDRGMVLTFQPSDSCTNVRNRCLDAVIETSQLHNRLFGVPLYIRDCIANFFYSHSPIPRSQDSPLGPSGQGSHQIHPERCQHYVSRPHLSWSQDGRLFTTGHSRSIPTYPTLCTVTPHRLPTVPSSPIDC